MRVRARVTPKSRAEAVELAVEESETSLRIRVTAAPEDGKANDAVVALLAERLGVPRRAVRVVGGAATRAKWIEIDGLEVEDLRRRLGPAPKGER